MTSACRRIALDRRVCVVREGRIDIRPERSAVMGPLLGLALGVSLFVLVAMFANRLPVAVLALMLIPGLILAPLSAMGLVYSLVGAQVVIDAAKQSARIQQGVLGLGLGTMELVPFWKIAQIEVADLPLGEVEPRGPPPPLDFRGWEVVLVKTSGKRVPIGQVLAPNLPDLIDEGFDRAMDAAEAVAGLVGKPLVVTAAVEEPVEEGVSEGATPQAAGEEGTQAGEHPSPGGRAWA